MTRVTLESSVWRVPVEAPRPLAFTHATIRCLGLPLEASPPYAANAPAPNANMTKPARTSFQVLGPVFTRLEEGDSRVFLFAARHSGRGAVPPCRERAQGPLLARYSRTRRLERWLAALRPLTEPYRMRPALPPEKGHRRWPGGRRRSTEHLRTHRAGFARPVRRSPLRTVHATPARRAPPPIRRARERTPGGQARAGRHDPSAVEPSPRSDDRALRAIGTCRSATTCRLRSLLCSVGTGTCGTGSSSSGRGISCPARSCRTSSRPPSSQGGW